MFTGSYLLLWVVVIALAALNLGMLRQIGLLRVQVAAGPHHDAADLAELHLTAQSMGPDLGTPLQPAVMVSANGYGDVHLPGDGRETLLLFLTPLCDGCQAAVDALNAVTDDPSVDLRLFAVVSGDERAVLSFIKLFPLHMPTIADTDYTVATQYKVAGGPFALLFDEEHHLMRKALLGGGAYVLPALLHNIEMDTGTDLYPVVGQEPKEEVTMVAG